jgi:hypothetical protein
MEIHPVKKLVDHYERIDDPEYIQELYNNRRYTVDMSNNWWNKYEFPWRCDVESLIDAFEFYEKIPHEHRGNESSDDILEYATVLYHERVYGSADEQSDDEW